MNDNADTPVTQGPSAEVAVWVSRSCRVGQSDDPINTVTRHLPTKDDPFHCAICWQYRDWPCQPTDTALHQIDNAGLRRADFVPAYLHSRLPRPSPRPPAPSSWPGENP
ncbi:hypothetical protein [Amycolatopsis sp. cmx-11-12]|uniref:hypothetical protein n=1 Tax=Amycolatopsis sp. cmx-11-12 TaxID=2785795 RepID=UPI00391844B3